MTPENPEDPPFEEDDEERWMFDPSLAALNRSIQRQLRQEAEEVEAIVAQTELRERSFAYAAMEARNRGDLLAVGTERRSFTGQLVYAAGDFVTIRTDTYEADINMAAIAYMRVVQRGVRSGGIPSGKGPGTFEMRLLERQSPVDRVEVGYRMLEETVVGRIISVGQDHVVIVSDQKDEWIIPLASVAWVIRRDRHR